MNGAARDSDESHDLSRLLMHRFNEYLQFAPAEMTRIRALGEKPIALPRSSVVREQAVRPTCVYILIDGWAAASIVYASGNRQIAKVHLPGDLMGVPSACLDLTAECLTALTPVVVSRVPLERFGQLFAESPRFAAAMFLSSQRERIALIDAMSRIGRTSSAERLAALLLDLHERLSRAGHARELRLDIPITQEDFADILGMTSVHVNRCFKKLQNSGSIRRSGKRIEILDPHALAKYARWSPRSVASKLDWLTEPAVPGLSGPRARAVEAGALSAEVVAGSATRMRAASKGWSVFGDPGITENALAVMPVRVGEPSPGVLLLEDPEASGRLVGRRDLHPSDTALAPPDGEHDGAGRQGPRFRKRAVRSLSCDDEVHGCAPRWCGRLSRSSAPSVSAAEVVRQPARVQSAIQS